MKNNIFHTANMCDRSNSRVSSRMEDNMSIEFKKSLPTAEEYNKLRENVGWGTHPEDIVEKSLKQTLFGVSVYDDGNIIGSGRIVGDEGLCFIFKM